jgi:hypothetical protein
VSHLVDEGNLQAKKCVQCMLAHLSRLRRAPDDMVRERLEQLSQYWVISVRPGAYDDAKLAVEV